MITRDVFVIKEHQWVPGRKIDEDDPWDITTMAFFFDRQEAMKAARNMIEEYVRVDGTEESVFTLHTWSKDESTVRLMGGYYGFYQSVTPYRLNIYDKAEEI